MPSERLLTPQERTFKIAMSALTLISPALLIGADLFGGCCKQPVLTQRGLSPDQVNLGFFDSRATIRCLLRQTLVGI